MADRHLVVIDGGSGEVDDTSAVLPADYALLEEAHRKVLREKAALKAQLTKLQRADPNASAVEGILIYWRNRLRGPTSRVDVGLHSKRADVVRKRLVAMMDGDDTSAAVERIQSAIDGCAAMPFEGAYGKRYAEDGEGRKRKDDLTYILRDEVKMEQFEAIVEADDRRLAYRAELKRRLDNEPNLRLVLASLYYKGEVYGEILARAVRWCATEVANG